MRVIVETVLSLREPSVDLGFITWFDARVIAEDSMDPIATARAARIHAGQVDNYGEDLSAVLDADSAELGALHALLLHDGTLREELRQGVGSDVFYLAGVNVSADWQGRGIDLALARRLCDSVAEGCELAVLRCESEAEAIGWQRMGFQPTGSGYVHLQLALLQARIVPAADGSTFKVVPNPPPGSAPQH